VGKLLAQPIGGFLGLFLVQGDTGRRRLLDFLPLRLFETAPSAVGDQLELLTVVIEAVKDGSGDIHRPLLRHVVVPAGLGKASLCQSAGGGKPLAAVSGLVPAARRGRDWPNSSRRAQGSGAQARWISTGPSSPATRPSTKPGSGWFRP